MKKIAINKKVEENVVDLFSTKKPIESRPEINILGEEPKKEIFDAGKFDYQDVQAKIVTIDSNCFDICPTVGLDKDSLIIRDKKLIAILGSKITQEYEFTDHSLGQLCAKLEIPSGYIKKCYNKNLISLGDENLNKWLDKKAEKDSKYLLRGYHHNGQDCLRGILSDKYTRFDSIEIFDTLNRVTKQFNGYEITNFLCNSERFSMRLICQDLKVPKEDMYLGIHIDSSDVGRRVLNMQYVVYKQICTNGMMGFAFEDLYSHKHIGITPSVFADKIKIAAQKIPEVAAELRKKLISAQNKEIILDSSMELDAEQLKAFARIGIPVQQLQAGAKNMIKEYDNTLLGFVHGLTRLAQDYSLDSRIILEEQAGRLLVA